MSSSASFSGKPSQNSKISQEQGSNTEMSKKVPSRDPSPAREPSVHLDADIPGFEFELEENLVPSEATAASPGMPRFEDFRHPNVKLFVVAMALLCNTLIFVQGFRHLFHQYSTVLCVYFDMEDCFPTEYPSLAHMVEFVFRFIMEMVIPLNIVVVFVLSQLIISVSPALSLRFNNPIPSMVPPISITCFFYSITNFLTSISMLPAIAATSRSSIWIEYLTNTALGLFWMYSLLNIFAFSQLTTHNFIRAREKHHMNLGIMDA